MKSKEEKLTSKIEKKVKKIFNLIQKLQEEIFNNELEKLHMEYKKSNPIDFSKPKKVVCVNGSFLGMIPENYNPEYKKEDEVIARNISSIPIRFGYDKRSEFEKGCGIDVEKLKDVYEKEIEPWLRRNKNYKEYCDMWKSFDK